MGLNDRIVGGQAGVSGDGRMGGAAAPLVPGLHRDRAEAEFDRQSELKGQIHSWVIQELGPRLYNQTLPESELRRLVRSKIEEALISDHTPLSRNERQDLVEELIAEVLGYGPIEEFLRDPTITEVMVNGYRDIYIERAGKLYKTEKRFRDEGHFKPHHPEDRRPGGPARGRIVAVRGRPSARRVARQRHPAARVGAGRGSHHPEVLG